MAIDLQTLAAGFLRQARLKEEGAAVWLNALNAQAVAALAAGDQFVTSIGFEGGSNTMERNFDAQQLLQVTEMCLTTLDAEDAEGAPSRNNRYGDHSAVRSTWG
jgi:hypothetical protein